MEWTGAVVLPLAGDCFLMGRPAGKGWRGFGDLKENGECQTRTAARAAFEHCPLLGGSTSEIQQRIQDEKVEWISNGPTRTFICRWPVEGYIDIPARFKRFKRSIDRQNSIVEVAWMRAHDVYLAIALSILNCHPEVVVDGRRLSRQIVWTLRKSEGYQDFLRYHPGLPAAPLDPTRVRMVTSGYRNPGDRGKGLVPLVVLNDDRGEPGKVFAVIKSKNPNPEGMLLENRSYLNANIRSGYIERIAGFVGGRFSSMSAPASRLERLYVWRALKNEGRMKKLRRSWDSFCLRFGLWISKRRLAQLEEPLVGVL